MTITGEFGCLRFHSSLFNVVERGTIKSVTVAVAAAVGRKQCKQKAAAVECLMFNVKCCRSRNAELETRNSKRKTTE